jgi:hypothetical protein
MQSMKALAGAALLVLVSGSDAAAEVQLAIRDGRVTLVATNATVRQILTEWARVGQTQIVNVERIGGGPVTLELAGVPESEALDLLLRSVTGYMASQRAAPETNLSQYDRILVLPTAAIARVPVPASASPVFQPPAQRFPVEPESDEGPTVVAPRGPLFPTLASPQPGNAQPQLIEDPRVIHEPAVGTPNAQPPVSPFPGGAVGTPRPGMVMPAPVQPGAGGQPGQQVIIEN